MASRILFHDEAPTTQSVEAVKGLITFYNHGKAPEEMPAFYRLSEEMVLVLSNKKDSYYVTTINNCNCPAKTYNPGQSCKHQRQFFNINSEKPPIERTFWHGEMNGPVFK